MYMRVAAAMFSLTMLWMPGAAAVTSRPSGPAKLVGHGIAHLAEVEPHLAAQEITRG